MAQSQRWSEVQTQDSNPRASEAIARLHEIANRDEATTVSDRADDLRQALAALPQDRAGDEVQRLRHVIDRDRYIAANALNTIRAAISGRRWLSEAGRGPYAYDDERYQQEFGGALDEIDAALVPLTNLAADKTDCATDPVKVQAARDAAKTVIAAPASVRADALEEAARFLEAAAERVGPVGKKRVPMIDQHTASVLRANAVKLRALATLPERPAR